MSTSLLYHGFGLKDQEYLKTEYKEKSVVFHIRTKPLNLCCSGCGSPNVVRKGINKRTFRTLSIGLKPVYLNAHLQRLYCKDCGLTRQERIKFADEKKSYTRNFDRFVITLLYEMTISDAAGLLKVSWGFIKSIDKNHLEQHYAKPRLKDVNYIAIDEFAARKGHQYMTVVLDFKTGHVLYVGEGRSAETLAPFWRRIKSSGAKVKAVAMDMWPAYIESVQRNLPKASIIFDRFHIVQKLNEHLSNIRRALYRDEVDLNKRAVLKGTRWLLLKKPDNLLDEKRERQRLEEALKVNRPLAMAYYLKEELSQIWSLSSAEEAKAFLGKWVAKAKATGIKLLDKFANTLLAHRTGIFSWFDHPISTSPLEGINNKIKVLKRRAYGFRDKAYFKLKIMALHKSPITKFLDN